MAVTSFKNSSIVTGTKRTRVWDQSSAPGNFYSIATNTVGAAGASEVIFSNIPQIYTHLQIRFVGRVTHATTDLNTNMQFNGDAGVNYSQHGLYGNGASTASTFGNPNMSDILFGRVTGSSSTSGIFGNGVVDILDYTNTNKFKTIKSITGHDQNGSGYIFFFSGNWRSTNAITSIRLFPADSRVWAQHSSFSLYGVL